MYKHYFKFVLAAFFFITGVITKAQTTVPYYNTFDNPLDGADWTHYAISGNDDWTFTQAYGSYTEAWKTGYSDVQQPGERVLETPAFNLTGVIDPVFTFNHRTSASNGDYFKLEYSIDNGTTWLILDNTAATKLNWQGASGFFTGYTAATKSSISLTFLNNPASVKFRFRCLTNFSTGFGWVLNDIYLGPKIINFTAQPALNITTAVTCATFTVSANVIFTNTFNQAASLTTKYFLSANTTLDPLDLELGTKTGMTGGGAQQWDKELSLPASTQPGNYYILYKHDNDNAVAESNEEDNTGMAQLTVKPVLSTPYFENFETPGPNSWDAYISQYANDDLLWDLGQAWRHHYTGAHSGTHAWHTSNTFYYDTSFIQPQWVESPFLDLSQSTGPQIISLWASGDHTFTIQYNTDCSSTWTDLATTGGGAHEWYPIVINLPDAIATLPSVRFRIQYQMVYTLPEGVAFDDVYIGPDKPDVVISGINNDRFTLSSDPEMSFSYSLLNSTNNYYDEFTSHTKFYWSADDVLDTNDPLLGTKQEADPNQTLEFLTTYTFTKPTTAPGTYYLFCKMDANNEHDERQEDNNVVRFKVNQQQLASFPYFNDFETEANNWEHSSTLTADDWHWGTASGATVNSTAFSGSKALIAANSNGRITPMSRMHYYSPIFDLTATDNPVMEFDMHYIMNISGSSLLEEDGGVSVSCSTDGGQSWFDIYNELATSNMWLRYTNYNRENGLDEHQRYENSTLHYNSNLQLKPSNAYNGRDCDRTTHYVANLSDFKQYDNVRFRFNIGLKNNTTEPDLTGNTECTVLVDNFSIAESTKDLTVKYSKELQISALSQKIKFFMHVSNQGNSATNLTNAKFYVSTDTTLDASDYYLGETLLNPVRPDNSAYINTAFSAPDNLDDYQYLIYELDANNANIETNKTNNIGAWPLALNSQETYPYTNEFDDIVVNGWHQYCTATVNSTTLNNNYRMRNTRAPNEYLSSVYDNYYPENGIFATERINPPYFSNDAQAFYLESPSFNFTTANTSNPLFVSFEFYCMGRGGSDEIGTNSDGGTMQYSIDGGTTWNVLEDPAHTFYWHFFDDFIIDNLDTNGWHHSQPVYVQASCSLAFLAGQPDVVFRYKYCSKAQNSDEHANGLRIKNFKIGVDEELAVKEMSKNSLFTYYPNPVNDVLNLHAATPINNVAVYTITGQKVVEKIAHDSNVQINLSGLSKGVYLAKVTAGNKTETAKIILQ
ncbi:T9SS type A sorting domain-containing protein [Flavobacterium subsaxonicum]|uniref:Secretion system C-terminal sorting domain-containing protein n=1 Tax=Flavobacterium subsaxonicum WB 4.1-42 = DSM 21790 TaxID=1121898 RepID=A0A0A2MPH7_9FLAO|nr:T9SS type A sorting domain-containing protein [Flavobacterium subsaxonicum]KGO94199.1 hypothetical protein Q766_04525 [Flavobacterium subsaxonicum WB 4.1-42 = DSM 21790]